MSANRFTIDHVNPRSLEGSDDISNLALACRRCNERRYNVTGIDPATQETVLIFNPRSQKRRKPMTGINFNIGNAGQIMTGNVAIQGDNIGGKFCERLNLLPQ